MVQTTKVSKEKNTPKIRKISSLPLAKLPRITAPKVSKQVSVSTTSSASRVRTAQSLPRSRKLNSPSTDSSKKVAPKSLHMSVSPGPATSPASAPTTIRKSYIMESMGNKDIVKRAFKMFENNVRNLDPPGCDRSPMSKQVSVRVSFLLEGGPFFFLFLMSQCWLLSLYILLLMATIFPGAGAFQENRAWGCFSLYCCPQRKRMVRFMACYRNT